MMFRITGFLAIYLTWVLVNDVKWTISNLSLAGSCPGCIHDISVFVGPSLSEKPELSCALCSMEVMDFKLRWSKVSVGLWESPFGLLVFVILAVGLVQFPGFPKLSELQVILDYFTNTAVQYLWNIKFIEYFQNTGPEPTCCLDQGWRRVYLIGQSYCK